MQLCYTVCSYAVELRGFLKQNKEHLLCQDSVYLNFFLTNVLSELLCLLSRKAFDYLNCAGDINDKKETEKKKSTCSFCSFRNRHCVHTKQQLRSDDAWCWAKQHLSEPKHLGCHSMQEKTKFVLKISPGTGKNVFSRQNWILAARYHCTRNCRYAPKCRYSFEEICH